MTEAALIEDRTPADLLARWGALKTESPSLRIRDAAAQMGVAEAELVAARCGDGVDRLTGPWSELIERLPTLGTVMSLTRNDHVVHEKTGRFGNIKIVNKGMGLVLNQEIDLRLLLSHWQSGFSVTEPAAQGVRRSLQFFDENGTAIQKIYQTEETDREAWQALIDLHLAADQAPGIGCGSSGWRSRTSTISCSCCGSSRPADCRQCVSSERTSRTVSRPPPSVRPWKGRRKRAFPS